MDLAQAKTNQNGYGWRLYILMAHPVTGIFPLVAGSWGGEEESWGRVWCCLTGKVPEKFLFVNWN
jgi:hypothetical protein